MSNPTVEDVDFEEESESYKPINKEDLFAKERLKEFVFADMDSNITFTCPRGEGDVIIQRMRVRLSKLRGIAIRRGRVIDPFKMLKVSITSSEDGKTETVILKKSRTKITDVTRELARITEEFPIVAGNGIPLGNMPAKVVPPLKGLRIKSEGEE